MKKVRNTAKFQLWSDHSGSQVEKGLEQVRLHCPQASLGVGGCQGPHGLLLGR